MNAWRRTLVVDLACTHSFAKTYDPGKPGRGSRNNGEAMILDPGRPGPGNPGMKNRYDEANQKNVFARFA